MGSPQSWPRASADGGLSEQFAKDTGIPLSAVDLLWSYPSTLGEGERAGAEGLVIPGVYGVNPGLASTPTFQLSSKIYFGGKCSSLALDKLLTFPRRENIFDSGSTDVTDS